MPASRATLGGRARRLVAHWVVLAVAVLGVITGLAWAYWTAPTSAGDHGEALAATVSQGATPTVGALTGRRVSVDWGATTLSNGQPVTGYVITRGAVLSKRNWDRQEEWSG